MDEVTPRSLIYHAKSHSEGGLVNMSNHSSVNGTPEMHELPVVDLSTPAYLTVLVTSFYSVIFVFGVIGNVMVILVVWRNKTMRNSTNVFLVNLSVADLSVILVCMPAALLEFYSQDIWHLGEALCRIVPYLNNASVHASAVTILAISFERYYAICCPLKAQYICTLSRTFKVIFTVWLFTLTWTSPFLWMSRTADDYHSVKLQVVKICRRPTNQLWQQAFIISNLITFFALPFFIIVVLYGFIIRRLSVDQSVALHCGKPMSQSTRRQRRQVVFMLLSVIILFFACVLPFRVVSIWLIYVSPQTLQDMGFEAYLNLLHFVRIMFYLNSACNPILYNVFSTKFRNAFWNLCNCCSRNHSSTLGSTYHSSDSNGRSFYKRSFPLSSAKSSQLHKSSI